MPKMKTETEISVLEISQGEMTVALVGLSPLIFNRMAAKAQRELLLPRGRKTAADRAENLKHNPVDEFRDSVHRSKDDKAPTRLLLPAPAFKGSMMTAALDLPGTRKTEIGRLVWIEGHQVPVWGKPQLHMSVVRMADIAKTPDIRTRAIVPEWATVITVRFVRPKLKEQAIINLLAAGGITCGVGDFRQEKGKGSFGQFRVAQMDDPDFLRIMGDGAREAQDAALKNPICYDAESEELLTWFSGEIVKLEGKKSKKEAA